MRLDPRTNAFFSKLERLQDYAVGCAVSGVDPWLSPEVHRFIEQLEITTPEGKVRLKRNSPQEKLWHWWLECREKRIRARGICCKCRQQGISTFIEEICWTDTYMRPHRRALLAAHDVEGAESIFIITKNYYEFLKEHEENIRPRLYSNKRQIHYGSPHNSIIITTTSRNKNLGSGKTINMFHASEVAKWHPQTAVEAMGSVKGCLARAGWDSLDFWESTAMGDQGLFAETWNGAVAGTNGYQDFFFGYQEFKDHNGKQVYFVDLPEGMKVDCTPEERQVQIDNNLSEGHFAFWLQKKNEEYNGSFDLAHQEFPASAKLAFKHGGNPILGVSAMDVVESELPRKDAIKRGVLKWASEVYPIVEFEEDPFGWLEVYEEPREGRFYALGVDIGEGAGKGGDYSVGQVGIVPNRGEKRRQVAKMRTNDIPAVAVGLRSFMIGSWYNWALIGIESVGIGLAALGSLKPGNEVIAQTSSGYPNSYRHVVTDRVTKKATDKLGWNTQATYKDEAIARFQQRISDLTWSLFSAETFLELRGIQNDVKPGKTRFNLKATYPDPITKRPHDDNFMSMVILNDLIDHVIEKGEYTPSEDGSW